MLVVAGLSIKNLHPRVWDPASPFFLPDLRAVMVSYAEFHQLRQRRRQAMEIGLRAYFGVPSAVAIYLDNGAFYFLRREGEAANHEYEEFVERARPDWYPIPRDVIPSPSMTRDEQRSCRARTMEANLAYPHDGYVPVLHISQVIDEYIEAIQAEPSLVAKPAIALGGIVPNLLRRPKARPYLEVLSGVEHARRAFADKAMHLFGVGGTATLHLAALLEMDSVDSSGWRNRAARGIVQLPGRGDRLVADLGKWRGREPSDGDWETLGACACPACRLFGLEGLTASKSHGFGNRATHNLWVLLNEVAEVEGRLGDGSYGDWFEGHLDNSVYVSLVRQTFATRSGRRPSPTVDDSTSSPRHDNALSRVHGEERSS